MPKATRKTTQGFVSRTLGLGPSDELLAEAKRLTDTLERVQLIAALMSDMRWNHQASTALANVWDLGPERMRSLAAEASRLLAASYENVEDVIPRMCAAIERAADVALRRERAVATADGQLHMVPDPDSKAVIQANLALAQILRIAPKTAEIEVRYGMLDDDKLVATTVRQVVRVPRLRELLIAELRRYAPELLAAGAAIDTTGEEHDDASQTSPPALPDPSDRG